MSKQLDGRPVPKKLTANRADTTAGTEVQTRCTGSCIAPLRFDRRVDTGM